MKDESNQAAPTAADEKNSEIEVVDAAAPAAIPAPDVDAAAATADATVADTAAPEVGSAEWIETASAEDLQRVLSGQDVPADEPAKTDEEDGPKADEKEAKAEEKPDAEAGPETPKFEFTPDADEATQKVEEAKFLELFEIGPEVQTMLDRRDARITELSSATAAAGSDESVTRHMSAFDRLVEFKHDAEIQAFVPDTSGIIDLLQKDYAAEFPQVVDDINSMPSQKYAGYTVFQEFIRDYAKLDTSAMDTLNYFLENNGQMPVPPFVPEGIQPNLAQAFWTAENREELQTKIEAANYTLTQDGDATAVEKQAALNVLASLNKQLQQVQNGIDHTNMRVQDQKQQQQQYQTAVQHETEDRFIGTTRGIIGIVAEKAVAGLEMMDKDGAAITGTAFGTLIETAFSDNDGYAKYAQDKLAEHGVTADWPKALAIRDRLFDAEQKIVVLEKTQGVNPRAIENAKREKDLVVKELLALAHEAGGKINQKVVSGAGKKLAKQIETAPRIAAVRPRTVGDATKESPKTNYDDPSWTVDKLREEARRLHPAQRALGGDLSGYA